MTFYIPGLSDPSDIRNRIPMKLEMGSDLGDNGGMAQCIRYFALISQDLIPLIEIVELELLVKTN